MADADIHDSIHYWCLSTVDKLVSLLRFSVPRSSPAGPRVQRAQRISVRQRLQRLEHERYSAQAAQSPV